MRYNCVKIERKGPRHRRIFPDYKRSEHCLRETSISNYTAARVRQCSGHGYTNYLHARTNFSGSKNLAVQQKEARELANLPDINVSGEKKEKRKEVKENIKENAKDRSTLLRLINAELFRTNLSFFFLLMRSSNVYRYINIRGWILKIYCYALKFVFLI